MNNKRFRPNVALARRLQAAGIQLEIPEERNEGHVLMWQVGAETDSCAIDLDLGRVAYMVHLRIVIDASSFALAGFGLELPWENSKVSMLEDPDEIGSPLGQYRFPCKDVLAFDRSQAVNHHANVRRILRRGTPIQGLLLAVGEERIPDDYVRAKNLPAFVLVADQFDRLYRCGVSLFVLKRRVNNVLKKARSSRKPLFACPDPGFGYTEHNNYYNITTYR